MICAWWCIVARKWTKSPENCKENGFVLQQGFSTVGSVAAWGLPAAHTIAVLVTRDVDADELSGKFQCYKFHFIPLLCIKQHM